MTLLRIAILGLSFLFILGCDDSPRDDDDSGSDSDSDTDSDSDSDTDTDTDTDADCQGNNVWLDESTGLCWQDPHPTSTMTWAQAVDYCEALVINEYDDWRLPKIQELIGLIVDCHTEDCIISDPENLENDLQDHPTCEPSCATYNGPGMDGCYFPSDMAGPCSNFYTWSISSSETSFTNHKWTVGFGRGSIGFHENDESTTLVARCVR